MANAVPQPGPRYREWGVAGSEGPPGVTQGCLPGQVKLQMDALDL